MITYNPAVKESIEQTAENMADIATSKGEAVVVKFNGVNLTVNPGDSPNAIVDNYHRAQECLASPEY